MILNNLKLRCYRNLAKVDIAWNEHFNVIYGLNAQGKTNLLEAIYLLGHLKSFRSNRGQDLINHLDEEAWVGAVINKGGVIHQLEIGLQKNGRNPRVDGKTVQKLSHFLGYLRTVLFTPEELSKIKGFPAGRRALLDRAILQIEPAYLDRVQEYERILRQRNQLLKKEAGEDELAPWTEALVRTGSRIRHDRQVYLERFQPFLCRIYKEITGGKESARLIYSVEQKGMKEIKNQLNTSFERLASRERSLGLTLAGPHRDDLNFLNDERSLRSFGSQGQQRSFLLAFKAAQVMDLEEQLKEPPILLLDDLASELDSRRLEGFFSFLLKRRGQVFLTSAQQPRLADPLRQMANFYKVDQGLVTATTPERG